MTNQPKVPRRSGVIPMTSDYGFKVTFGNPTLQKFICRALQALIQSPHRIQHVEFVPTVFEGSTKSGRSGIYDVVCTDETGQTFIVEMQRNAHAAFLNRLKFYTFQRFDTLVKKGNFDFGTIERIYGIGILGSQMTTLPNFHNILTLKNQDGIEVDDQLIYVTVELSKFRLTAKTVTTDLEKLIFMLKNAVEMTATKSKPAFLEEDWLKEAFIELDIRNMTPEQYESYMHHLANEAEEKRYDERLKMESEIKGKMQGKIEGKMEVKIEMIQSLLLDGIYPIERIAQTAKVPIDFVLEIKSKL